MPVASVILDLEALEYTGASERLNEQQGAIDADAAH
jgi:hypothetical protein